MGRIVWLASYPKSGNTWMRAFLHNVIHDRGGPLDLNAISGSAMMDAGRRYYEPFLTKPWEEIDAEDAMRLRPRVQRAMAESSRGTVLVKTHSMLTGLSGIPSHDPELTLGAIYVVRDPRDVAVSYADHLGITIDGAIESMATPDAMTEVSEKGVAEFLGSWSQHVSSWTAQEGATVIALRYEDMLATPKQTFGQVVRFLHLDVPASVVRKAIENTAFDKLTRQEARKGFGERSEKQERFFRRGRAGGWRAILSAEQRARIEADHGAVMRRYGYLDDEEP